MKAVLIYKILKARDRAKVGKSEKPKAEGLTTEMQAAGQGEWKGGERRNRRLLVLAYSCWI
jgi:hypothetical protein